MGTTIASANWALTNVYYAAGETIKYQVQKQRDRESERLNLIIIVILCTGADELYYNRGRDGHACRRSKRHNISEIKIS